MPEDDRDSIVDLDFMRRQYETMRENTRAETGPDAGVSIARATARIVENAEIEVRCGKFTFRSDEPDGKGGRGNAPRPLQYFAAGTAT